MTPPLIAHQQAPGPLQDLLRRFDVPGPRYTSYPTADRFTDAYSAPQHALALRQRREGSAAARPLSLYIHIPFCASLCYYCACNKIVTRRPERGDVYLRDLGRELAMVAAQLGSRQAVRQLHLGGGSPTFLNDAGLRELLRLVHLHFVLAPGAELSIEVDPRTVDVGRLAALAEMGFNRLSFGVQDFDPAVQEAVHRVQPAEQVFELVAAARALRFASVNVDLIHGLPRQTAASFDRTLAEVARLRPDRIALYAYAHLPERFKAQRRIDAAELPTPLSRSGMLSRAMEMLGEAGYEHVGMDHFALPHDPLAVARRQGRLHRGFQGYSTQPDGDLIGLGVSAISRVGPSYSQNAKKLDAYVAHLDAGRLPVERGLALSRDDLLRGSVIMALMCHGELPFESIELSHLIDFRGYFATELAALQPFVEQGLVELDLDGSGGIYVTPRGWFVVRAVAMVFDRHLREARGMPLSFSRIV